MNEYQPTIIENRLLLKRLAIQIAFLRVELKRSWIELKTNPRRFLTCLIRRFLERLRELCSRPYAMRSSSTAVLAVACTVILMVLLERTVLKPDRGFENTDESPEVVLLNPERLKDLANDGFGKNGNGRLGFQAGNGEGSGPSQQLAQGGGGGGDQNPLPPQAGELPPPSPILAPIPIAPPINPPALPVAGIDLDPALWQDLKEPVFGDPFSPFESPSKGPGKDGGIGSNAGLGVGDGVGPGVGPGTGGNIGDGSKRIGGGGSGGSIGDGGPGDGVGGPFSGSGVAQRARLLLKPEPQYTEEARRNGTTGTVVLRVVFASSGEVVQIRALRTLPFGLTERAIAAARQIKFVPAMNNGHPVSVFMQLEYNFNLY